MHIGVVGIFAKSSKIENEIFAFWIVLFLSTSRSSFEYLTALL